MPLLNWLRTRSKSSAPTQAARRPCTWLGVEAMEDRTVPSWVGQIGGTGNEYFDTYVQNKPVTDPAGNVYLVRNAVAGAGLDPGAGVATHPGGNFVAKYTPNDEAGNPLPGGALRFEWARALYAASHLNSDDLAVAADGTGAVYVVGHSVGTHDFGGGYTLTSTRPPRNEAARPDAYVLRLSGETGQTAWARRVGGTGTERAYDVATDEASVYVLGDFYTTRKLTSDFDPDPARTKLLTSRHQDMFLLKLTGDGAHSAVWQMGGSEMDTARRLLLDGGTAYVGGRMLSSTVALDPRWSCPGNTDLVSPADADNGLFIASVDVTRSPDAGRTLSWGISTPNSGTRTGR